MKTSKSPENTEVTPSKKKLKQARLPFKLITDVSSKPDTPQPRKRKLSVPDSEPVTKVGKICKENDLSEDLVVISDDESIVETAPEKVEKIANPLVKLVDNARKKKLQKAKTLKKAKSKSKKVETSSVEEAKESDSQYDDIEMVDVEVIIHEDRSKNSTPAVGENPSSEDVADCNVNPRLSPDNKDSNSLSTTKDSNVVVSDDENCSNNSTSDLDKKQSAAVLDSNKNTRISREKNQDSLSSEETVSEGKGIKSPKKSTYSICLDDSSNSCDVQSKPPSGKDSENKTVNTENDVSERKSDVSKPKNDDLKTKLEIQNNVTPKRSTRIKQNTIQLAVKTAKEKASKHSVKTSKNDKQTSQSSQNHQLESTNDGSVAVTNKSQSTENNEQNTESQKQEIQKEDLEAQNNLTPKRTRTKAKDDEKATVNMSVVSSKLDDSVCSSPVTPKQDILVANLTPKQLQKRLESAKKKEEREKEKQEREKKRLEEKEERAKQKQEKEDQRRKEREDKEEAKKKEREEKEELKKKEREEKEKQKELERKQKEEEKRKEKESKEEQRKKEKEAREEEKRKRQEAQELEKQEQELKKKKAAEAFVNFFVPKQKNDKDQSIAPSRTNMLSSFTIKGDMRLAPTIRADLTEEKREALEKFMEQQGLSELYLKCLRDGKVMPQTSGKTWPLSDKDDDVMIVEDELPPLDGAGEIITCDTAPREKLRPKLFSFHENRRPPYWGTWRKKSVWVKPRRPFGQEKIFDYEVDSDDDWEEEQDGESLDGSVCGSEEDGDRDDYEVDHELFVPHGYLSDEEATMDEDDVLSLTPETQKARLKHLEDEFESEMKKPTEKLKPRMYGLLWENNGGKPDQCVDALWNYFTKFSMIIDDPTPFFQPSKEPEETEKKKIKKKKPVEGEVNKSPKSEKKKKVKPETKEGRKAKAEPKKIVANQPGINSFLFSKVKSA